MENKIVIAKQGTIDFRNVLQGLIMAILVPVVTIIEQSLNAGELVFNWKSILTAALAGGVAYLFKKFVEPTKVVEVKSTEEAKNIIENASK